MSENFSGERATVEVPADSSTDTILRFSDGFGFVGYRVQMPVERAGALVDRWNAVSDALSALENPGRGALEAATILRRVLNS